MELLEDININRFPILANNPPFHFQAINQPDNYWLFRLTIRGIQCK